METETLALAQEVDFSFWALFLRATLIVKLVMALLLVASFYSWAIIVTKHLQFRKARGEAGPIRVRDVVALWRRGSPPDGPASRSMSSLTRSGQRHKALRRRSLPPECWNGAARIGPTAG